MVERNFDGLNELFLSNWALPLWKNWRDEGSGEGTIQGRCSAVQKQALDAELSTAL